MAHILWFDIQGEKMLSFLVLPSLFYYLITIISCEEEVCNQDLLDRSFVTQCSSNICEPVLEFEGDKRPSEWPASKNEVVHIVSSRGGERFKIKTYKAIDTDEFYYEESHVNGTIFVDTATKYQRILGFGSTLTDASCTNVDSLPEDIKEKLIKDYFSTEDGIGLNLIKVPIGSTKYSFSNYVLDQPDSNQVELSPYDTGFRIPLIREAMKAAGKMKNRIRILATSASAPPELKDNNKMIHGGSLKKDKYHEYATYLSGFVAAYKTHDLNIWSVILTEMPVTIGQKKDANDTLNFNSMSMKPSETLKLIEALNHIKSKQSEANKFRLLLLADDRIHAPVWADAVFKSKEASQNVAGFAYVCQNTTVAPYDNLVYVTKRYPNKYLLASQSSINAPAKLGDWQDAENYATEIIKNLEYGSVGWIDFNLALNLEGGPAIDDKYNANAAIMVDSKKAAYYRNPMFYAIGHLSKYVKPGSIRVKMNFYSSAHMWSSQHIAFVTPDNYLVVLVMNNNIGPMPVSIGINTRTKIQSLLDTKSFNTFVFKL